MKTLSDKKVNKRIRTLNRQIENDVFGKRFIARQVKKQRLDGVSYYHYLFIDNENPDANIYQIFSEFEITMFSKPWEVMNELIVNSDFWEKYYQLHPRTSTIDNI
jgi:hypothetical protein